MSFSQRRAGAVRSVAVQVQRRLLDEIGGRVGTPVVYLKAAWADPVLYGGRGERQGCDIDVLVRRQAFSAFASALEARGFAQYLPPGMRATIRLSYKAWTYMPPAGMLPVDLHRGLVERPWFLLPAEGCIARAVTYDSPDGPLLSLSPEDQVVYAAAHYASHRFALDQRHLEDVSRLMALRQIDWSCVARRAQAGGLGLATRLLTEALRARGTPVPAAIFGAPSVGARLRHRHARRWVGVCPELTRTVPPSRLADCLLRLPLLSGRPQALPAFLATKIGLGLLDRLAGR